MIKAVLFDYDGVLVNSLPFHVKAWQNVLSAYNIKVKPDDVRLREGSRSIEIAREIFEDWNVNISEDALVKLVETKQRIYRDITKAKLEHGVEAFLDKLKRQGILLGLVTGSARLNVQAVLNSAVTGQFDIFISGDDVNEGKPSPEAYLKAAHELNVAPSQCLVIENAPLGIEAAKKAGMLVVGLTTTLDQSHLDGADFIAQDLMELANRWETFRN
ncbi:MAG: HAD family hydrolase [bacterium]